MKNTLKFLTIFASLFLIISCYGEYDTSDLKESEINFRQYLIDMAQLKGKGTVLLQSNEFETTQKNPVNINISERQGNEGGLKLFNNNNQIINIQECNNSLELKKNLFGSNLKYQIENQITEIYFPKLIQLNYNEKNLQVGSTINWNIDQKNKKGVIVFLTYSPIGQTDLEMMLDNNKFISDGLATLDNGSYTFTEDDLERFPKGASLSLNILRGNYIINEIEKPSLIVFSKVSKNVVLEK
ncbi:hypothetical protein FLGE108171_04185 [Flavobacterium gelidilacus]|jgi:hypothetical protein|uniref:hypothetical protein n=1 Tax=Flavobacterium gelidilacus TaxID=206041 RepID=UPI00047D85AC|nr:hypothetical protein [Flavobacterium gelidilacus]